MIRFKLILNGLRFKYNKLKFDIKNDQISKESRIEFLKTLIDYYYSSEILLLFFDITSFSENSFKKK